jgi:hypothetical protein
MSAKCHKQTFAPTREALPVLRRIVAQGDVDLGEHRRGRNRGLDREWVEIRGDKALKCKVALTTEGGKYQ